MDRDKKRRYWDFNDDVELGTDWSVLYDDLMLTGGNDYLHRDEALRMVEKIKMRTRKK